MASKSSIIGFTLLELLVVMVIIGLLASFVAPRYFGQIGKSEVKTARAQLDAFDKALSAYRIDTGHYPSTEQGLQALALRPGRAALVGPLSEQVGAADPWGHAYVYRVPGEAGHEFDLLTLGRDGATGGSDLDADISVWATGR
jgi:general secretion pathway protein G